MSDVSNINTAELTDAELDFAIGGATVGPNNSTHEPLTPVIRATGPFTTTGPFNPHTDAPR